MSAERIAIFLFVVPLLIVLLILKSRRTYFLAPDNIISRSLQKSLTAVHFFSTLFLALGLYFLIDNLFGLDEKLEDRTVFHILVILGELLLIGVLIEVLIHHYLISTNAGYKNWRRKGKNRD